MIRKVVLMTLVVFSSIAPCFGEEKRANRLVKEKSPYLLLHAHNPVDWYPWGEEAFAKAKKENKDMVFLMDTDLDTSANSSRNFRYKPKLLKNVKESLNKNKLHILNKEFTRFQQGVRPT